MGDNTMYYVKVVRPVEEWIEINVPTADEAIEKAREMEGVMDIKDVKHWTEFEEIDGC